MPLNNGAFVYLIAAGLAVIIGFVLVILYHFLNKMKKGTSYEEQLKEILEDEFSEKVEKVSFYDKWSSYWGFAFKEVGFVRYSEDDKNAGRDVLILGIALALILSIVFMNPILGFVISAGLLWVLSSLIKMRINKKSDDINNQLPGFLFALKANIQANETPERAIIKVIDGLPSPLYDDLVVVKNRLLTNSSFKDALLELSAKTASKDLKFLAACMIQASSSGSNIESQIVTIQKVLTDRQKVNNELNRAIKAALPSIWVSSILIPGVFLGTYIIDPNAREFWFVNPISWIAIGLVGLLYGFGVWGTKKLVDNIKNL